MSTDTENNTKNQDINPDKNQTSDFNDNNLNYEDTCKPWNNVVRGRCTCTANVYPIQRQLIDEKITPINSDDAAFV